MNDIQVQQPSSNALGVFDPVNFDAAMKVAEALMKSSLVPDIYKAGLQADKNHQARANVLIALNMSKRMNADPLMVMQNLYIVHQRPAWSSQFLIACFNCCGRFSALQYKFSGEPGTDEYGCYAWAVEHSTGQKIEGTKITLKMAREEQWSTKAGSKWKTMPDQMLRYRAATFFIRTTAPEIAMGLQTREEAEEERDITPIVETKSNEKKYASIKKFGVKEDVIEGEVSLTPSTTTPSNIQKKGDDNGISSSSSWEEAKNKFLDTETGEIISKTPQQHILEAELQK